MRDFRKMFPTIEDEIIEAVLRANNGAVDDTIDQLLVMSLARDENAYAETLPKHVGDFETASPRVDVPIQSAASGAPNPPSSGFSTNATRFPSEWLADVAGHPQSNTCGTFAQISTSQRSPTASSFRKKKIYRPPLVGQLPLDFLRISSTTDPRTESSTAARRPSTSASYSSRRATGHWDDGPPPSYASAVERRYSESSTLRTQQFDRRYPQHTYLGVFRTTSRQSHPTTRSSGSLAPNADAMKEAMAENEWRRRMVQDPELAQYFEDERIAIMLQNEEFMRQLRSDRDFLDSLDRDAAEAQAKRAARQSSFVQKSHRDHQRVSPTFRDGLGESSTFDVSRGYGPEDPFPYTKVLPKPDDSVERSFQEKLTLMGRSSKRKFASMARRFIHKSRASKGILDNKESRTHVSLLDSDDELEEDRTRSSSVEHGYNQPSDAEYNIGHGKDLKQGRFF